MKYLKKFESHWSEIPVSVEQIKEVFQEMIDQGISVRLVEYNGEPKFYKGKVLANFDSSEPVSGNLTPYRYYQCSCEADDGNYDMLLNLLDSDSNTGSSFNPNNRIFKKLSALNMNMSSFKFSHDSKSAMIEFRFFR